jgi:hygromycin-B 7''-O-kinase
VTDATLQVSQDEYRRRFRDPAFGADLAEIVRARHGLPSPLVRRIEGSNLVFRAGDGPWLKLTPPFWLDAFEAEVRASAAVQGRLPARIPELIETGALEDWRYLISAHVPGVQAQALLAELSQAEREALADDLGGFMRAFHAAGVAGFERTFGPWPRYLAQQLATRHDAPPPWPTEIHRLVARHSEALRALGPPVLIHADLTAEHVMLEQAGRRWRLSGVLDLADTMPAPAELDLIAPFVELFRGQGAVQARLARAAGVQPLGPELTMALALQHRFITFPHWFAPELARGCETIEEVAAAVF